MWDLNLDTHLTGEVRGRMIRWVDRFYVFSNDEKEYRNLTPVVITQSSSCQFEFWLSVEKTKVLDNCFYEWFNTKFNSAVSLPILINCPLSDDRENPKRCVDRSIFYGTHSKECLWLSGSPHKFDIFQSLLRYVLYWLHQPSRITINRWWCSQTHKRKGFLNLDNGMTRGLFAMSLPIRRGICD